MARIVCQVLHRADRITFLWSEGAASFEPYHLEGAERADLLHLADQIHARLAQGAATELAQLGHRLYRAVFRQQASDGGSAHSVETWLRALVQANAIERLEFLSDAPGRIPWNVLIDEIPDGSTAWPQFWGARFLLGASRRVNALRSNPIQVGPVEVMAADLQLVAQLSDVQRQSIQGMREGDRLFHTVEAFSAQMAKHVPDALFCMVRFENSAMRLGSDTFTIAELRGWMDQASEGSPEPLMILMGVGDPPDQRAWQAQLETATASFSGLIANETLLPAGQAFALGQQIAEQLRTGQQNLGEVLRTLRQQGGPALAVTAFCPVHLRGVTEGVAEVPTAEVPIETYPLPLRPYRPFAAFDTADRALFVGREDDTIRLALATDQADTTGVFLHGSPTVGKTSFLQAGLIPYLEQEAIGYSVLRDRSAADPATSERDYPPLVLRATSDLAGQFADALSAFCAQPFRYTTPAGSQVTIDLPKILQQLVAGSTAGTPSTAIQTAAAATSVSAATGEEADEPVAVEARELWFALRDNKELLGNALDAVTRSLPFELVLLVDQGEELLTLVRTTQEQARRKKALEMLAHLTKVAPRCKIVFTLRSQALGQFVSLLPNGRLSADWRSFCLRPLSKAEMVDALLWPTSGEAIPYSEEIPAQKYGFAFEDGLAQQIVEQAIDASATEQQGPLPTIQAVGALLYDIQVLQRKQNVLRAADLKGVGGVKEALGKYLDLAIGRLPVGKATRAALKGLIGMLYTSHADGSVGRDLMQAGDLKSYWQSAAEPVEATVNTAAEEQGLFEIQQLLIGGQVGLYVSLPQDSLARLGQKVALEKTTQAFGRTKVIDVLWIMIPLVFLAAAVTFWATRHFIAGSSGEVQELTKRAGEFIEKLKKDHKADLKLAQELPRRPLYFGQLALAHQAMSQGNALRARQILLSQPAMLAFSESRKDDSFKDLRGFEWKYLWRRLNGERHLFEGHRGVVNAVAISPDSQWAASGSGDGTVRVWNLAKGEALALLTGPKAAIHAVAFAPDGKMLAAAGADKVIRFWDVSMLKSDYVTITKEAYALRVHTGAVNALAFGKDANTLASGGADKAVILWDLAKGTPRYTLTEHTAPVTALASADEGKLLVSAGADGKLVTWDADTGKKLNVQKTKYSEPISGLAISPDGKTIGTGGVETRIDADTGLIRFWSAADLKEIAAPIEHANGVLSLAFSPDGKSIASGGTDHVIRLWDLKDRKQLHHWIGHLSGIRALAFAKKGSALVSGDHEGIVKVWNPDQSSGPDVLQAHADWVQCLALNKKNTLLASGARDGSIKLWDPSLRRPPLTIPGSQAGAVTALTFSSHEAKTLLAASTRDDGGKGEIRIWQIDHDAKKDDYQFKLLHTLRERKEAVTCLAFHPRAEKADLLLSGSADTTVRLWDAAAGKEIETYRGHKDEVRCVAFLHEGKAFVSGGKDGLLCYAEIDRKDVWPSRDLHLGSIESVALLALPPVEGGDMHETESAVLTAGADHTIKLWLVEKDDPKQKIDSKKNFRHIRAHAQGVTSIAYQEMNDGLIVSASWDGTVKLYDRAFERFTLTGHQGAVRAVVIAADQSFIASAGNDGTIRIWRAYLDKK